MLSKRLHEIKFPIFTIRKYNSIEKSHNLVRILTHHDEYVLDSMLLKEKEPDYAQRRIKLAAAGYNMYPLKVKYDTIEQMSRAKSGAVFIDSDGDMFKYKRGNKFYTLKSYEIKRMVYNDKYGTTIEARDIHCPLFTTHRVSSVNRFVNCVNYKGGYLMYSLSETPLPPKRIKL